MATTTTLPVVDPVVDSYDDVKRLIYRVCWIFKRKFGGEIEELFGDASIAFMRAYGSWEDGGGMKFSSYVATVVYRYLEQKRKGHRPTLSLDFRPDEESAPFSETVAAPEEFDLDSIEASPAAKFAMKLALDPPMDLVFDVEETEGRPTDWRVKIKGYLRMMGWTRDQILETFEEVRKALG